MKNIVLARIDERLIHGQVATQWLNLIAANTIVVADDKIPSDNFMTMILKAVCPRNCELHLLTAEEAAEFLKGEPGTERVFVVTKGPEAMLKMIECGCEFKEIILGNMGNAPGRTSFNRNVSASPAEVQCFRDIVNKGVPIYQQMVPIDAKVDISNMIK
ncbi:MAG: PTS sugar transporter subunit IIB [Erysipelotrichaceae bacterium]|nr:PTS sugar transporter subunit IIB [Erysipelotrichaceae bacterium]MBR6260217.1 PTS sugar transporter subunit IIB [Erysipelotrichaceae bacterium]